MRRLFLSLFILASLASLHGASEKGWREVFPDNSAARREARSLFLLGGADLLRQTSRVFSGDQLEVPVRMDIAHSKDGITTLRFVNRQGSSWVEKGWGSVEIMRPTRKAEVQEIRMYPDPTGSVRIIIRRQSAETVAVSVQVLGGSYTPVSNVRLAVPMDSFVLMPVHRMMELSASRIRWDSLVWNQPSEAFASLRAVSAAIRASLPGLPDTEDGAMDEEGRLVMIETGLPGAYRGFNCSGFAKWMVDGFYRHLVAEGSSAPYLPIGVLKERLLDHRGNERTDPWEERRDPFFGLDWTRNLATILARARGERASGPESRDLRSTEVAAYVEDKGYRIQDLPLVFYAEAIRNPGRWYLVSVNGEFGTDPAMWQHYHVVGVFPWFDSKGRFVMDVYERNVASSWESVVKRYPQTWGHPVWLESDGTFTPPEI